jgi:hypothetical protein
MGTVNIQPYTKLTKRASMPPEDDLKIPNAVLDMLNAADTDAAVFPPTFLYNEGWMLRLVLSAASDGVSCLPIAFRPGSRWFSEALLYSPFLPRSRTDPLAEKWTHVDGVVGHFRFAPTTKTGLELRADSKQFVAIEAKMYSALSRCTKNAPFYDQAARTVACMATTIERAGKSVDEFESLGFYVFAPTDQIGQGVFSEQMSRSRIVEQVQRRIATYHEDHENLSRLQIWFQDVFDPVIRRIDLQCWPWDLWLVHPRRSY